MGLRTEDARTTSSTSNWAHMPSKRPLIKQLQQWLTKRMLEQLIVQEVAAMGYILIEDAGETQHGAVSAGCRHQCLSDICPVMSLGVTWLASTTC